MWNLMTDDAISVEDKRELSSFILSSDKLTQGKQVKEFERQWSAWLDCKYSVFVNSGSSANLMLVRALCSRDKEKTSWVSQACTWSTTISPIIQNGSNLFLCDVDLNNFSPSLIELEKIFKDQSIDYLFLTHLLGFCAISKELLGLCDKYGVVLVEDCCEAHGASFEGKKVGTFGVGSTFSFFYGHHMTTIEGGMICTDNEDLYHDLLLLRSHGLLRELPKSEMAIRKLDSVDPLFCFLRDGYNLRNTEINATLGLLQLPRLDASIEHRNKIFSLFLRNLDSEVYETDFNIRGCSNFALPIFVKNQDDMKLVKDALRSLGVEYRPCIAGNLHLHPLTKDVSKFYTDENVQKIHDRCIYVGNHKDISTDQVLELCSYLNSIK
jgi:CDP-6-deoxy-D-xylo-4-hexulose-3-dehydrase